MHLLKILILSSFLTSIVSGISAQYTISGKVNMQGEWQHVIYLATIDKLDDYYSAKAEHIINMANIEEDGSFKMQGDNLPNQAQFYKLYLVREEHSEFNVCLFVGGDNHNFVHIILDNNTDLEILADPKTFAPFGDYTVKGNTDNALMKSLSRLIYPSYQFYEIRFPSELQFSENKLNRDLFNFADTCTSTLVSLAAINNTDFDDYFQTHVDQYKSFGEELKSTIPDHPYTNNYFRKLSYYGPQGYGSNPLWKYVSLLLSSLLLYLLWKYKKLSDVQKTKLKPKEIALTEREKNILKLIKEGKSNKEIASDLFIGVSTVKTHINKLYAKMEVSNRQEAKEFING